MTRHLALLLVLLLPLAACATLSEDQCRTADWQKIGFQDGIEGRDAAFLQNHARACQGTGIAPDATAYERGRTDGLAVYCTPLKAYIEGRGGMIIKDICPAALTPRLRSENSRGFSARFELRDRFDDDPLISAPSPGLYRAPPAILDLPNGRDEYDILRRQVNALRVDYPLWF